MKKYILVFALALFASRLFAQETQVQFLSGTDKDNAVPWKFFCTAGTNSGIWTNLPVPSQWDVKGFGTLHYGRDATNPAPESGLYEHEFTVPANWAGQRMFLVFEGAMTDTSAKLNGESVGPMHQGSFYRFKYDVTKLVKPGAVNKLEVRVDKHSANRSVNAAERQSDYWLFGGIFRPVHLDAVPQQFIERVAVDAKADGTFALDVFAAGDNASATIEAQIKTLDGKSVGKLLSEKISGGKITLKTQIASPKLWTAETPNLYRVEIALKQDGKTIHQTSERFGFRTMEVREGDGLYVNGSKVILKGVDRHSFWPDSGRTLNEAVHRLDIETMKDANMNAVRMSHYPPDVQFLDLCDELGLYVLDELGGWHGHYDTEVGTKLVEEMVTRDVNHPCILFWDNGNEGGWNTNLDHLYAEWDPQGRHVLHPWAVSGGVNTAHYKTYADAEKLCAGTTIYMPTEFEHGLFDGGAGAGLEDYWKMMMSSKICAGGFIWALLDEGVKRPDTGQIDVFGNAAPDGIVGPYRQREGSFYTIKQLWSPLQILQTNLPARLSQLTLTLENHYGFINAKDCKFIWQLRRWQNPGEAGSHETVSAEGPAVSPVIAPGETGKLILNLPENFWHTVDTTEANAFSLRIEDPNGRELWTYVWPLQPNYELAALHEAAASHAKAGETGDAIEVKSGDETVTFSKQTGFLTGVQRGAKKFSLANGPRPAVGTATLREIHFAEDGPDVVVSAKFDGALKSVSWRVNGNGWVRCDYTYAAEGTNEFFGVLFDYPENQVTHKRWLGNGPYRVWKNRLPGTTLGVWENDYNNTVTGFSDWIYPEFKGFFADVRWLQLETGEGEITVVPEKIPFVQVLTPEFPTARLAAKSFVAVPECGLGFLDAIPPVGSKFHGANSTGPLGQPNIAHGEYSGSVNFYFGKLP